MPRLDIFARPGRSSESAAQGGHERATPDQSAANAPSRDLVAVRGVIAALSEPIVAIDSEDRVLAVNDAARSVLPTIALDAPLANHLRSPDVLDAIVKVRESRQTARTTWLERVPVERLFEVHVSTLEPLEGDPVVIVQLHELSETRRFEKMRVDFITNASHELRTPLASLLGFIETLQGPARNDEKARTRFLHIMRDQAQRMARLVDDLLSLSRVEQHLHLRPKETVDLALVLRHIADTLIPLACDHDVELILQADGPIVIPGDRDELMRVAENLIENAIKYGASEAKDRRVIIGSRVAGSEAVISVRDFGAGISAQHLPRLTERFYRVDAGASRAKGGTGLGLALVKHIVARHRGRLHIESSAGKGAEFRVMLPLLEHDVERTAKLPR